MNETEREKRERERINPETDSWDKWIPPDSDLRHPSNLCDNENREDNRYINFPNEDRGRKKKKRKVKKERVNVRHGSKKKPRAEIDWVA